MDKIFFMNEAINEAKKAYDKGETPIGVSPLSYAFLASFIASFIKNILSIFPPKHITY